MKQVEKLFLEQCAAGAFPGGQLVVQRGNACELDLALGIASGFREAEGLRVAVTQDTRFQVMSASKEILTEVLQRITGRSLPEFCAAEVGPSLEWLTTNETAETYWLGKPNYTLNGSNLAANFEATNNGIAARTALVPGAGMYASARSLARFYTSLLADGSASFQRYTRVQTRGFDKVTGAYVVLGRGFGLGWRLPHPYGYWNSQRSFGHCGGFSVVAYADRGTQAAVAIVTNGNRGVADLVKRFAPLSSAIRSALQRR